MTLRNNSDEVLALHKGLFSLESEPPTAFVPAETLQWGRAGYRMPAAVEPGGVVQGEVFFGIRGSEFPTNPITFRVRLPDGDHTLVFKVITP